MAHRGRSGSIPLILTTLSMLTAAALAEARPILFARTPHVSQGKLVFSYHGDIWVANADGSRPMRLTASLARNTFPRLSPDGRWVAFTSNRMGNDDVWVMPAAGGEPRQLTFFTGSDAVLGWTPDGQRVLFSTARGPGVWGSPLYTVSRDGGLPEPLPMDRAGDGMIKQDGSAVAFTRGAFRFTRKGYRGNASEDVWVQDLKTKAIGRLTDLDRTAVKTHVQDVNPMWGADGQVYFVSERDGFFNVWRVARSGGKPLQVTSFKKDGVQFASMSPDGKTIAFENEFEIWTLDVPAGQPRKVVIDIEADSKENLVEMLPSKNKADGFDPAPEGDAVAIEFHGEIFLVPTDPEIGEKRQITSSPWRDQRPAISPDGRGVVYVSDESKEQEFWLFSRRDGSRRRLTTHASFKDGVVWAPDSRRLAVTAANRIFTVDLDTNAVTEVAHNPAGGFQVSQFSPDGKWLIYGRSDDQQNREVYAFEIAARREHNLTQSPFTEMRGVLTPDGRTLVFLSDRADGVNHLFAVSVEKLAEDPDDPLVKERLKRMQTEKKDVKDPAVPVFRVDADGIRRRAVQLTSGEQAAGSFFVSADGKLVYFTSADDRGRGLFSVTIDGKLVRPPENVWRTLNEALNEYVTVTVGSAADPNASRDVRIRTVASLGDIKYEEWVKRNREFVEKATGGQIAYVHIRSMSAGPLRRFQNEINELWDRKGIIVDIRYNGGGNIDQELLDILERRPYQYWNNRWGSRTWGRRPRQAIAGPKVMLVNFRSGSDSEVTPLGFRQLGLGRIVGNTTAAAVIATGSYGLINGGSIRTPGSLVVTYDPTKPNNYGINLENYGVDPDVWAENTPEDELKGFDRELQAAIDEVMRVLKDGTWQYPGPAK